MVAGFVLAPAYTVQKSCGRYYNAVTSENVLLSGWFGNILKHCQMTQPRICIYNYYKEMIFIAI